MDVHAYVTVEMDDIDRTKSFISRSQSSQRGGMITSKRDNSRCAGLVCGIGLTARCHLDSPLAC